MPNRFANGVRAIAMCDRCGQQFKLKNLKTEIIKQRKYELLVCPECWDPDQPQLMLGTFPVEDPQALRNPRKDNTYITAGQNNDGVPTGGSRDIQWGWNPVGGSSFYDAIMTPNYLVATTYVGTITAGSPPGAYLTGVSATGEVGNTLGPLPITGNSTTVEQGTLGVAYQPDPQPITGNSSTMGLGSEAQGLTMTLSCSGQAIHLDSLTGGYRYAADVPTTLGGFIYTYLNGSSLFASSFDHTYIFSDFGSGYVGMGYLGQFQLRPGSPNYWEAGVSNPVPSTAPAIGNYTINNFAVVAQFYIIGSVANQYSSYAESGGQATFTWTGNNALIMRDTYAQYPALPVGTEISAAVLIRSEYTWSPSQLYLGTFLSMGYSSGTFTMTYTVVNSFVPYPGGTPSVGMMYFNTNGITFLPLVINI